jgi:hypothetical protein
MVSIHMLQKIEPWRDGRRADSSAAISHDGSS